MIPPVWIANDPWPAALVCQELAQSERVERPDEGGEHPEQEPWLEIRTTLGLRLRRIDGSAAQFEEDVNLPEGPFLREFELEARRLAGWPVDSLLVRAAGVGEPFSSYRLESRDGPLRMVGRFDRTRFEANAQADQHPFDLARETGSLDFEYEPDSSGPRSGFGLEYLHRDGLWVGSRSVGLEAVQGFPVRRKTRGAGMHATYATASAGWGLDLELGLRAFENQDALSFALPSPTFPGGNWTEDFRASADTTSRQGELGLTRELGSGARLELRAAHRKSDVLGDSLSEETGFFIDPDLPFARTTESDLDLEVERNSGGVDLVWPVGSETELELGYARELVRRDGREPRSILLDEFDGEPPTLSQFIDTSAESSALDLFSLGGRTRPGERADLELRLEWGQEDIEVEQVVDGITVREFDGTLDRFGGEGELAYELGGGVTVDLGAGHERRPTESSEIGVAFDFLDDRTSFGRLGCRWQGEHGTLQGTARLEHRESEALTSEGDFRLYSAAYAGRVGERTTIDLGAALQDYSLESATNFVFFDPDTGLVVVPGVSEFGGYQVMLDGSLQFELEPLRPSVSWSAAFSAGTTEFSYRTARVTLPWTLTSGLEVGLETAYLALDGEGALDESDYDALLLEFFVRHAFAR